MEVRRPVSHVDMRESYLGKVDDLDTRFGISKGYVRLGNVLYKPFDIQKDFAKMVDVLYTHFNTLS